jgi:hypothetical protein
MRLHRYLNGYQRTAIVLAMLAVAGNAAELSVSNGVISAPNQPVTLNVTLSSGGSAMSGVQFDLQYDAAALNVTVSTGAAAGSAGKEAHSNVLQAGRQRVLIVGLNQTSIADGVVATLQVSLKSPAAAGKTFPITITAPAGTTAKAQAVAVTAANGSVQVEITRNGK